MPIQIFVQKKPLYGLQMSDPGLTVVLDVSAAALQHPGNLPVDGVQAELVLGSGSGSPFRGALLLQLQLCGVGQLQRLQQARLTLHQVGDRVHRQPALKRDWSLGLYRGISA